MQSTKQAIFRAKPFATDHPGEWLVNSSWETVEDWNKWAQSQEKAMMGEKTETFTKGKAEYHIFSPRVSVVNAGKAINR